MQHGISTPDCDDLAKTLIAVYCRTPADGKFEKPALTPHT
jgi:hypothetical protein